MASRRCTALGKNPLPCRTVATLATGQQNQHRRILSVRIGRCHLGRSYASRVLVGSQHIARSLIGGLGDFASDNLALANHGEMVALMDINGLWRKRNDLTVGIAA